MIRDQTGPRQEPQENQDRETWILTTRGRPLLGTGLDECCHVLGADLSEIRITFAEDRPQQTARNAQTAFPPAGGNTGYAFQCWSKISSQCSAPLEVDGTACTGAGTTPWRRSNSKSRGKPREL
jgi:hypothetical protein